MKTEKHADNTEALFGYRAEDIHLWIDQYFDINRFRRSVRRAFLDGWDPFAHRKFLHYREALPKALDAFRDKYPEDIIEKVFLQHLSDDYKGYIPEKKDFSNPAFLRKHHRYMT